MITYPEIEIERKGVTRRYNAIGGIIDSQEGYFYYWPKRDDGQNFTAVDWVKAFTIFDLSVKLYLIGSIYRHREEPDMIGVEIHSIINKNKGLFEYLLDKYFDDYEDGLSLKENNMFFDLIYGPYSGYGRIKEVSILAETNEEEEFNQKYFKLFEDGTLLRILDKEYSWDDWCNKTFIATEYFDELLIDINTFENIILRLLN